MDVIRFVHRGSYDRKTGAHIPDVQLVWGCLRTAADLFESKGPGRSHDGMWEYFTDRSL